MKCSVYEDSEQDGVKEKNAGAEGGWLEQDDQEKALKEVTFQLIKRSSQPYLVWLSD